MIVVMVLRFLVILALFVQPALGMVGAPGEGAGSRALHSTCCCGPGSCMAAAACGCSAEPPSRPEQPAAPRPTTDDSSQLLLLLAGATPAVVLEPTNRSARVGPRESAPPRARTTNEKLALLCVWRT